MHGMLFLPLTPGPHSFVMLNVDEQHALSPAEVIVCCEDFKERYQALNL